MTIFWKLQFAHNKNREKQSKNSYDCFLEIERKQLIIFKSFARLCKEKKRCLLIWEDLIREGNTIYSSGGYMDNPFILRVAIIRRLMFFKISLL